MGKKIKLQTHDGSDNYLEELEGRPNQYKLVAQYSTVRRGVIPSNKGNAEFIDPSGGPMIVVGRKLECYSENTFVVDNISFEKGIGHIITLK